MKACPNPHLLIIRLSAMGDVAIAAPVVKAFRKENPEVGITILTRPFFQPFFRDIDNVEFLTPDFGGRHKGWTGIIRLWRDIGACGITHVADLHDMIRTKFLRKLLRLSGKKVSVIDKGRPEKRALTRKYQKIKVPLKTTIERYRDTIVEVGFNLPEPVPELHHSREIPDEIKASLGDKKGKTWIGIAPFAQHKGKIYPTTLCDELIGKLSYEYDKILIFGGGEYEQEFAQAMEERYSGAFSVIGKIGLEKELDLISNLDLLVTMDSSAMHMASLMGIEAVSIWGATHPYAGFYGFGLDPDNAIQLDMDCRPCSVYGNKPCMYGDYRCMGQITTGMILEKVREAISKKCSP